MSCALQTTDFGECVNTMLNELAAAIDRRAQLQGAKLVKSMEKPYQELLVDFKNLKIIARKAKRHQEESKDSPEPNPGTSPKRAEVQV